MHNSLAKRLTYRIMAVVLLMITVITGLVFFSVRKYMLDEAQERYLGILLKNYEEFRRRLSDVYVAANNNVHDIERDIDNPNAMYQHMKRILDLNPSVKSSAILFAPHYFKPQQPFVMPMVRRDSIGNIYIAKTDSIYTYHRAKWYKHCMETDTGLWVGTYFDVKRFSDKSRKTMLTTYATPIHNRDGTPVALLCLQLSPESMRQEFMKEIKQVNKKFEKGQKHQSYCFVIDRHGNYIIHPDEKRTLNTSFLEQTKVTPDTLDDRVVARMVKGENGEAMMDVDGIHAWIYYRTVKYVDWTMVIVVPEDIIFHNARILNTIILLTMLFGLVAIYFICRHMIRQTTKPLHRFALSADQVALGNFSTPLPDIKSNDEVRLLHDAFKNMQTSLSNYVDELQKTTTSKAALERELKIAQRIQMAMLPKNLNAQSSTLNSQFSILNSHLDLYALLTPTRDVGGDLYDYFLRDNRLFFCIGDVTGKGVPAALLMAVMRAMFRSEARHADSATDIVKTMNRNLCEESTSGYFVTMFVGILDLYTGLLDYCNAGHEPPIVIKERNSSKADSSLFTPLPSIAPQPIDFHSSLLNVKPNLPIGALPDWNYEGQQTQLEVGDMLFLYTDGLSEAKNAEKKSMGRKRVVQLAMENSGDTAQQLVELMEAEAHRHADGAEQSDDITLLAIKWKNQENGQDSDSQSFTLHLSLPKGSIEVEPHIRRLLPFVTNVAQQAGIDDKEAKRLRLAVEEAVANIISYSGATNITILAEMEDGKLSLTIDDDGKPFDPTKGSSTNLAIPPDQRPPGGLGIILLHRMTDGLEYQRTNGHNILTLSKIIDN